MPDHQAVRNAAYQQYADGLSAAWLNQAPSTPVVQQSVNDAQRTPYEQYVDGLNAAWQDGAS